jgi:hypothetical protein
MNEWPWYGSWATRIQIRDSKGQSDFSTNQNGDVSSESENPDRIYGWSPWNANRLRDNPMKKNYLVQNPGKAKARGDLCSQQRWSPSSGQHSAECKAPEFQWSGISLEELSKITKLWEQSVLLSRFQPSAYWLFVRRTAAMPICSTCSFIYQTHKWIIFHAGVFDKGSGYFECSLPALSSV